MKASFFSRLLNSLKWRVLYPLLARKRRSRLLKTDFTIISNNCWGGRCYEYFGLMKKSPTIGSYFFAEDYVKFVSDIKHYLSMKLVIIDASKSKHFNSLKERGQLDVPVGKLDDVEIIFLHYKNPIIAEEKWNRRVKRVNYDNVIYKFSYQNECNDKLFYDFLMATKHEKSFAFSSKIYSQKNVFYYPGDDNGVVENDTYFFDKYIDVIDLINSMER